MGIIPDFGIHPQPLHPLFPCSFVVLEKLGKRCTNYKNYKFNYMLVSNCDHEMTQKLRCKNK